MSDHAPLSNTSYLWLERCETIQYSQLLAEHNKEKVQGKLLILKKLSESQKEQLLEGTFKAEYKVQLATLKRKRKPSLHSNESVSVLAHFLPERVPKDPFDIYQKDRKDIIDEKPDNVTLFDSHSQEKTQILKKLPISEPPACGTNLNTGSKVGLKSLSQNKNEVQFSFENDQNNLKGE